LIRSVKLADVAVAAVAAGYIAATATGVVSFNLWGQVLTLAEAGATPG